MPCGDAPIPYPPLSVGDFLARLFHDWDNTHGLTIGGGDVVFGDGHVHEGATRRLAVAAARAGIDDIEVAFDLGEAGHRLTGEPLYRAVRAATGAGDRLFRPERMIPRPSSLNAPQNWRAPDLESLWDGPIVGDSGTTVGEALTEMMDPDGYFIRQLDRLGQSLVDARGLLAVPLLGGWLARSGAQAYHRGFVERLATHPGRRSCPWCTQTAAPRAPPTTRARRPCPTPSRPRAGSEPVWRSGQGSGGVRSSTSSSSVYFFFFFFFFFFF